MNNRGLCLTALRSSNATTRQLGEYLRIADELGSQQDIDALRPLVIRLVKAEGLMRTEIEKIANGLGFDFVVINTPEGIDLKFVDKTTGATEELGVWNRHARGYDFALVFAMETLPFMLHRENRKRTRKLKEAYVCE